MKKATTTNVHTQREFSVCVRGFSRDFSNRSMLHVSLWSSSSFLLHFFCFAFAFHVIFYLFTSLHSVITFFSLFFLFLVFLPLFSHHIRCALTPFLLLLNNFCYFLRSETIELQRNRDRLWCRITDIKVTWIVHLYAFNAAWSECNWNVNYYPPSKWTRGSIRFQFVFFSSFSFRSFCLWMSRFFLCFSSN